MPPSPSRHGEKLISSINLMKSGSLSLSRPISASTIIPQKRSEEYDHRPSFTAPMLQIGPPTTLGREFLPFRNSFGPLGLSQFRLSLPCACRDGFPDPPQVALRTACGHTFYV